MQNVDDRATRKGAARPRQRLGRWVWVVLVFAAGCADARAQLTTCSTFFGKYHASTNCYTTPTRQRPRTYLSPDGVLHYWSRPLRTYCFRNAYNLERCIDRLDVDKLMCGEIDEQLYCRPFP